MKTIHEYILSVFKSNHESKPLYTNDIGSDNPNRTEEMQWIAYDWMDQNEEQRRYEQWIDEDHFVVHCEDGPEVHVFYQGERG